MKEKVSLWIDFGLLSRLNKYALDQGSSRSRIIRLAIQDYIKKDAN